MDFGAQKGVGLDMHGTSAGARGTKIAIETPRSGSLCGNEIIWHEALRHCRDGVRKSLSHVFPLELVSSRSL